MDRYSRETNTTFDQQSELSTNNGPAIQRLHTSTKIIPRTLPNDTISNEIEATPRVDYKDKLWTEIDALDDVKRMAKDRNLYQGFPEGFEEDITKLASAVAF